MHQLATTPTGESPADSPYLTLDTRDPARALAWQTARYGGSRRMLRADSGFRFRTRFVELGAVTLSRTAYVAGSVFVQQPSSNFVGAAALVGGSARMTCGSETIDNGRADTVLAPGDRGFTCEAHDPDFVYVTVSTDLLRRVAGELCDVGSEQVQWRSLAPVTEAAAHAWRMTVGYVDRLVGEGHATSPLVRSSLTNLVAAQLLATFPNSTHDPVLAPDGRGTPAAVRRAVAYIENNVDKPISVTDIADASGIGVRALQYAFQRHRDTTPMAYLRRARLERAHRDLTQGDPTRGDTVVAIAARWGFTNTSRFSHAYRREYGQTASQTLRS